MIFKQKSYWIDVTFGTIFIFFIMFALGSILDKLEFIDPVGDALEDMEITDRVFSDPDLREILDADTNIVLVNIGLLSRGEIGEQINIINKYQPKVIGLDAVFPRLKSDTLGDLILANALSNTPNIIMYGKLVEPDDDEVWNGMELSHPLFTQDHEVAHVNLVTESAGIEQFQFKTCRSFFPMEKLRDPETNSTSDVPALAVKVCEVYNPEVTARFLERDIDEEIVNYRGNIMDFGMTQFGGRFYALDVDDVLNENFDPSLLKDKIVLMGFLGQYIGDPSTVEDKYFTPMNKKFAGRALPDMFGVVIHANIVSMILNEDYMNQMTKTWAAMFAIIACILNVAVFQIIYIKMDRWYDGLTKLIQLVEAVLLLFVIVIVFHYYSFKLDLTYGIIAILLAGDSLEVYNGVVKNIFRKEKKKKPLTNPEEEVSIGNTN